MKLNKNTLVSEVPEQVQNVLFGEFCPVGNSKVYEAAEREINRMDIAFGVMYDFLEGHTCYEAIREITNNHGFLGAIYYDHAFDEEVDGWFAVPEKGKVLETFILRVDGTEL